MKRSRQGVSVQGFHRFAVPNTLGLQLPPSPEWWFLPLPQLAVVLGADSQESKQLSWLKGLKN